MSATAETFTNPTDGTADIRLDKIDSYEQYDVDWQLSDDWIEVDPDSDIYKQAAIRRYKIHEVDGHVYKYCIHFSNMKHHDYAFQDGTGVWHYCSTYRDDDHHIDHNNEQPNIVKVGWKP
ncbi:hypothetical protein TWF718_002748 [Orbilia javanica]|uniref:Uncharacterized protein n=1 Tax=Orbilia javanica TaxID=47235 RepID=A0AAN8MSZ4_9PEZI